MNKEDYFLIDGQVNFGSTCGRLAETLLIQQINQLTNQPIN